MQRESEFSSELVLAAGFQQFFNIGKQYDQYCCFEEGKTEWQRKKESASECVITKS